MGYDHHIKQGCCCLQIPGFACVSESIAVMQKKSLKDRFSWNQGGQRSPNLGMAYLPNGYLLFCCRP